MSYRIKMSWFITMGKLMWILATMAGFIHAEVLEYCDNQVFEPTCDQDEAILITSARYGRMHQGSCITGQHGKLGCYTNAGQFLDAKCSGRRSCSVTVATLIPKEAQPCSIDLKSYLEVVYECVKVIYASKDYCQDSEAVEVREQEGYLSSLVTTETGCGSLDSPWWLTVSPGQTISLTLMDFGLALKDESMSGVCHVYAVIKEQGQVQTSETVCAGSVREIHVYTSSSNRLEVRLVPGSEQSQRKDTHFLLHFEAVGCPDLTPPTKGFVARKGNDLTIGCDGRDDEWTLHCEGNQWVGDYQNCTDDTPAHSGASTANGWSFINQRHGLSILIILLIAVSVGLCILAVGLIHIKRRRQNRQPHETVLHAVPELQYAPTTGPDKPAAPLTRQYNKTGDSTEFYHSTENDYYRTWQLQRHAPQQMTPLPALPPSGQIPPPYMSPHAGAHAHPHPQLPSSSSTNTCGSGAYQKSTHSASEHIYESPKFSRKDYSSDDYEIDGIHTEYFELDPDSNKTT